VKEAVMKKMLTVATVAMLTTSCSGRDVDIGNGGGKVNGDTTGTAATTGGMTSSTTGTEPGTTGGPGTTVTGGSGMTSGGSGVTTSGPVTTGGAGSSGFTVATSGSGGASGTGGSGGSGAGGSSGVSGPATALVIRWGDIKWPDPGTGATTTTTGGTPVDPDKPFVIVGNYGPTCGAPIGSYTCGQWQVMIGIPRELFQPGVLNLNDPRLTSNESVQGPDRGGGDCWGGGGSFFDGTLEIVDIGPTIHVRLANTSKLDINADGAYAATNCQ
jgi:hypothetical protein